MAHISENSHSLRVNEIVPQNRDELLKASKGLTDVCIVRLPALSSANEYNRALDSVGELIAEIANGLGPLASLVVLGEVIDLVQVQTQMPPTIRYQYWIAVKRTTPQSMDKRHLPNEHFGALVYTRYKQSLRHTKTRVKYSYCPICDKTTKDYGGKKHTYHEVGTLLSDVWRDTPCDLDGDITPIVQRFADLFGQDPYKELVIVNCRSLSIQRSPAQVTYVESQENEVPRGITNRILHGDCIEELRRIPDNSIDFAFTDPPYNLGKKYIDYTDDLEIQSYFKWCDEWIVELARVIKPGRTLALLNIPLWAVRHFLYMETVLQFQNWIVWNALAFPVRLIMPAHYTILCFSKGKSRKLPGLTGESKHIRVSSAPKVFNSIEPLADGFCLRANCVDTRIRVRINDRAILTDLWGDIHRLKHNTRRVDHPCQLPPLLMYRLISIFTKPGELVIDCFNGAGTTTLSAHQINRKYIGIDSSELYCAMAQERHLEILNEIDPFRKAERILTSKNSPVPRLPKQVYRIPKKTLQLEVRRISKQLGHIPSRDEVIKYAKYSIDYYDRYFVSWGEVTAAARTTGMTEKHIKRAIRPSESSKQLGLFGKP